jgi:hypothetical protein
MVTGVKEVGEAAGIANSARLVWNLASCNQQQQQQQQVEDTTAAATLTAGLHMQHGNYSSVPVILS